MTDPYIVNPGPRTPVTGLKAACSTDSAIVTETIMKILREGGNAVDAAIAGCMVQAAVEPFMTNHAGTVVFLYFEAKTGSYYQLDSTGTFPGGIAPFRPLPKMTHGFAATHLSSCIPGFMPGLKAMYERFATRSWSSLCQDAIRWAEEGHPVSSFEYGVTAGQEHFLTYFPEGREFYLPNGYFTPVGQRFGSAAMARTVAQVAEQGPDHMISGGWARAFVDKANAMGWPITLAHMEETPPRWVEPLRFTHGEHEIVGLAPPQQQALYCAYVMGVLRHLGIADHAPGSAEHIFYMAHALRLGLYQCGFLGDPMVGRYAFDQLLDDDFQRAGARMIGGLRPEIDLTEHVRLTASGSAKAGRPTRSIAPPALPPSSCELSIVDAEGNWVQMMNTMQSGGIPGMVVEGIPMCGSHATFTGMSGNMDAKLVAGTRMRRALGSTFVLRDGVPVLSLGTPGNVYFTIPQMLTYLLDFGLDITAAQDGVRMLPMDEDGSVTVEDRLETATLDRLASWGVNTRAVSPYEYHMGSFQMCFRDTATGQLGASADPRRCGVADGIMA